MVVSRPPFPICEKCQRRMILVGSELAPHFANALRRQFSCECGATDEDIIAERTLFRASGVTSRAA
jgi:hypothetical protein